MNPLLTAGKTQCVLHVQGVIEFVDLKFMVNHPRLMFHRVTNPPIDFGGIVGNDCDDCACGRPVFSRLIDRAIAIGSHGGCALPTFDDAFLLQLL